MNSGNITNYAPMRFISVDEMEFSQTIFDYEIDWDEVNYLSNIEEFISESAATQNKNKFHQSDIDIDLNSIFYISKHKKFNECSKTFSIEINFWCGMGLRLFFEEESQMHRYLQMVRDRNLKNCGLLIVGVEDQI